MGKTAFSIAPPDLAAVYEAADNELFENRRPQTYETTVRYADGTRRDVIFNKAVFYRQDGSLGGLVGAMLDISERKRAEEEKALRERQLRQAQKMEAIGTLAGGIAHDFNNILGVIIGCSELALEKLPPESNETILLEKVLGAGKRAKELVKQILTFSRQDKSEIRPLYLSTIVKETLKFIRATTPSTIRIEQQIDNDTGAVLADPTQLHRLLMNLYTNAVQAMTPRGGLLEVSLTEKELGAEAATAHADFKPGTYAELCVRDTGTGIAPEIMERIFDPFFTTKPVGEGTGLGLSVVHGIVKKHNGAVSVDSRPDRGTTFRIYLPRLDKGQVKIMEELESGVPAGNERILLVDDEQELLDTLLQMLEALNYTVSGTPSSLDAYDRFRRTPEAFDLVIADLTMPNMTGIDLAGKIHRIAPDLPIILCTGFSELITTEQAREAGVRRVARWQLATTIRKVLDWEDNGQDTDYR